MKDEGKDELEALHHQLSRKISAACREYPIAIVTSACTQIIMLAYKQTPDDEKYMTLQLLRNLANELEGKPIVPIEVRP